MKRRRETVDIVGDLVAGIDTSVNIKTITDNLDGSYTITTCNTKYLKPCLRFDVDSVTYEVIDEVGKEFVPNEKFTVKGGSIITQNVISLPAMKYFHGTVIATSQELDKKQFDTEKFPMVYLLEVINDNFNNLPENKIDRVSDFRIFFLTNTDEENWLTADHYRLAIKPMRNMLYQFIEDLNNNANIEEFSNFTAINHARFGVYTTDKGHTRRVLNDKTSGVEVRLSLPIVTSTLCTCT